jgi:hypothetical protein
MADIAHLLGTVIEDHMIESFQNDDSSIRIGDRRFRLAYLEEAPGIDDETLVVIEPATGDLYQVDLLGVQVRRIEPAKDEPVVDPNQLALEAL